MRFSLWGRKLRQQQLEQELRSHLQMAARDRMDRGESGEHAQQAARREFGNVTLVKQVTRDQWGWRWLEELVQDVRYGARMLRKNPGFTLVAVLTLALGIGANTAIFSVVDTVLLRPMPYPDPDRIVQFMLSSPQQSFNLSSIPKFMAWRQQTSTLQDFAAYETDSPGINLTEGELPEQLRDIRVSADYFRLFGATLDSGRTFTTDEDRPGGGHVVVISDGLWRRRFGGDPHLVGRAIRLGGQPYEVIGVLNASFVWEPPRDVWLPLQADPNSTNQAHVLRAAARLKPGVSLEAAKEGTKLAVEEFHKKFPGMNGPEGPQGTFTLLPLRNAVTGSARPALLVLLGAVSFVLLIACANVANLLLARAATRGRELSIRVAIGASRGRIVRQLLTESVILSITGGSLGIMLGYAGLRALLAISPADLPRVGPHGVAVELNARALLFTLFVSAFTGMLFGLLPAISFSRTDPSKILNEGGVRSGFGLRRAKSRYFLVVSEIALALVLLAGAALLIRSFTALQLVDPGFDGHNVLSLGMSLAGTRFQKTAAVAQLVREAEQRVESLSGVTALATTSSVPLEPNFFLPFTIEGRPLANDRYHGGADYRYVSPRYFEVFRIPLRRGRMFTERDDGRAPGVVLINEAMARQFWPKGDPLGERITIGKNVGPEFEEPSRQIVGVVADVRDTGLSESPTPIMYIPAAQLTDGLTALGNTVVPLTWVVRTKVEPYSLGAEIERELRQASGGLPVAHVRSMHQVAVESTSRTNFNMMLLSVFAGLAMLLASIGIYGLMAYAVHQRTHEIGVRMALGARAQNVLVLVFREGLSLALTGIAIGLLGAAWLTQTLKSLLFGISPNDPVTLALVGVLLLAVAAAACYIPARRAMRVDPLVALRYE